MKHEWRKHEKALYNAKEKPSTIVVPCQNYIIISGKGNPNEADFSERVGVLYSLAYSIKIRYKASCIDLEQRKPFDYIGAFDNEPESFVKMNVFAKATSLNESITVTEKSISLMPVKLRMKKDKQFCGIRLRRSKYMGSIDLKKVHKDLFFSKENNVSIIDVPEFNYLSVDGEGHPSDTMFKEAVEALYNVVYTVKMIHRIKDAPIPEGFYDFIVPPLQCQSWLTDTDKKFAWKLYILQPDFVNADLINTAISIVKKKGKHLPLLQSVKFVTFHEGKCVQCLHIGPFNSVKSTYVIIEDFMKAQGFTRNGLWNEIYLSDQRKTPPEKLRTIIRCPVT